MPTLNRATIIGAPMSRRVERMFSSLAADYDRANHVLSFGADFWWRHRAVHASGARPGDRVLDVACGTGDLATAFQEKVGPRGRVVGVDFSQAMVRRARGKAQGAPDRPGYVAGDALRLPFRDDVFDVASVGFGIRNVDDPVAGLREMARTVRPGGFLVVLEFGQPEGLLAAPYRWYSRHVLPRVGGWITGDREAYEYLHRTAAEFPCGDEFLDLLRQTGLVRQASARPLSGGIAYVYRAAVAPA